MGASDGKSWLKYGCFGCISLVVMLLLAVAVVLFVAWKSVDSEQVENQVIEGQVSAPKDLTAESDELVPSPEPVDPAGGIPGMIILDLSNAEFIVRPGEPGDPLRVDARYDRNSYELIEKFDAGNGSGWTHRITFRRTGGWISATLRQIMGGTTPKLEIFLPTGVPMDLTVDVREGAAEAELGGLTLRDVELDFEKGGFQLGFGEPAPAPLNSLIIRGAMGGFEIESVGNASPRNLEIDCRMGGAEIDLRGQWSVDSEVLLRSSMAGGVVHLPRGVRIEGLAGKVTRPTQDEVPLPTLRFSPQSQFEDLEFID